MAANLGAVCPWLTGYIYDMTGSYDDAWWLAIVVSILSIGAVWMAAPRKAAGRGQGGIQGLSDNRKYCNLQSIGRRVALYAEIWPVISL